MVEELFLSEEAFAVFLTAELGGEEEILHIYDAEG